MKNLTDLKCRNCNKITCSHGLDFAIIIVHFEENKKCNITYKLYSKNGVYDYIDKHFSNYTRKGYIVLDFMHYIFDKVRRFDKKNEFVIIFKRTSIIDIQEELKEQFNKWLNNKITYGRFNEVKSYNFTKCSIDDLLYNGNINHFKNKTRYVNMVIEIELYKQQFYKALYMED